VSTHLRGESVIHKDNTFVERFGLGKDSLLPSRQTKFVSFLEAPTTVEIFKNCELDTLLRFGIFRNKETGEQVVIPANLSD